jgi:hypothetical protein
MSDTETTPNASVPTPYGFYAGLAMAASALLLNSIPWDAFFLLTRCIGISMHSLSDRDTCVRVQKRVGRSSHITDGGKNYGYSIGWGYIASISITTTDNGVDYECWLLCTAAAFKALTEEVQAKETDRPDDAVRSTLSVYQRLGAFYNPWFKKRTIPVESWSPRPEQDAILDAIQEHQERVGHTVCYIHGEPGGGKSILGIMLADRLKGSYCNTLKPWQPGDSLGALHNEVEPSEETPLIVSFDEFDGVLTRFPLPPHKNLPTEILDKHGWNHFFDDIHRGLFPHVVILLTSNRGPDFIRALCPSYIRPGRVDLVFELNKGAAGGPSGNDEALT